MGKGGDGSAVMRQRKTPSLRTKPGPSARRETRDLAPKTPVQKLKNDITVLKHIWCAERGRRSPVLGALDPLPRLLF